MIQTAFQFLCISLAGENKRIVTLIIVDDEEPEDNETIVARLTHTEGGSRILPSSDTVTIVILANDYVGVVVNFHASSLSATGQEGGLLCLMTPLLIILINFYSAAAFLSLTLCILTMTFL